MRIVNIVLTGGPCGGKTSVLDAINKLVTNKNNIIEIDNKKIKLITIPETATELISNGVSPNDANKIINFQDMLFSIQKAKEDALKSAVNFYDVDICMFVYDRGLLDGMAYLENKDEFNRIMTKNDTSEISLLDKYDLVIDLLSTATCAEKKYGFESNSSRFEDVEWAKEVDNKTTNAWVGHRNLKIFDSSIPLNKEVEQVIECIKDYLLHGTLITNEEYKVNINYDDFNIYNDENSRLISVSDTEIDYELEDGVSTILTKRKYKNNSTYFLKFIANIENQKRIIKEERINEEKYNKLLLKHRIINQIIKDELCFFNNKRLYRLSFYDDYTTISFDNTNNDLNNELPACFNIVNISEKKLEKKIKYGNI